MLIRSTYYNCYWKLVSHRVICFYLFYWFFKPLHSLVEQEILVESLNGDLHRQTSGRKETGIGQRSDDTRLYSKWMEMRWYSISVRLYPASRNPISTFPSYHLFPLVLLLFFFHLLLFRSYQWRSVGEGQGRKILGMQNFKNRKNKKQVIMKY